MIEVRYCCAWCGGRWALFVARALIPIGRQPCPFCGLGTHEGRQPPP